MTFIGWVKEKIESLLENPDWERYDTINHCQHWYSEYNCPVLCICGNCCSDHVDSLPDNCNGFTSVLLPEEENLEFRRADGGSICTECNLEYRKHPFHPLKSYDDHEWLRVLCNGTLVKL